MTASLLNSWLYATDPDASEDAYVSFLATLERTPQIRTKAMETGVMFENLVTALTADPDTCPDVNPNEMKVAKQIACRVGKGMPQVRATKVVEIAGMTIQLVGIADWLGAGVISDIKRVQRYEYGKYQHSAQHPMYLELFPEAMRFDYLVYDGQYFYLEPYRRGDCRPIQETCAAFLRYLEDAHLMDIYKEKWEVKTNV